MNILDISLLCLWGLSIPIGIIAIKHPNLILILLISISTGYLGLIDFQKIPPQLSLSNHTFLLNLALMNACIILTLKSNINISNKQFPLIVLMPTLLLWGVFFPVFNHSSTVTQSIIDGKDYFSIFALIFVILVKEKINKKLISKTIVIIAIYLASAVLASYLLHLNLPGYGFMSPLADNPYNKGIHIKYSTYLCLGLLIIFSNISWKNLSLFLILLAGILIQPHTSITVVAILIIVYTTLISSSLDIQQKLGIGLLSIIVSTIFFSTLVTNAQSITMQLINIDGALGNRLTIGANRISYIEKQPFTGYGFINQTTDLGKEIKNQSTSQFNEILSTIDAGYLDLLVRFGFILTTLYLVSYYIYCREFKYSKSEKILQLYLLSFIAISLTWSVLTYSHGLLTIALIEAISSKKRGKLIGIYIMEKRIQI